MENGLADNYSMKGLKSLLVVMVVEKLIGHTGTIAREGI